MSGILAHRKINMNPYDIVEIKINGHPMHGRPFEFDSDPVNSNTCENASGEVIKPTKLNSVCPDCGQGLELEVHPDDPIGIIPIDFNCYICNSSAPKEKVDPFFNPIEEGRATTSELDPLLYNAGQSGLPNEESTVADRMASRRGEDEISEEPRNTAGKTTKKKVASDTKKSVKKAKKAKKKPSVKKKKPEKSDKIFDEQWPPLSEQ